MAEPIITGNGSGNGAGVSIPAPSFTEQAKAQVTGAIEGGFWEDLLHKYFIGHVTGPHAIITGIVSLVDWIAAGAVALFGMFQGRDAPGFYGLISEVLSDLLGVDINTQTIEQAFWRKGELGAYRVIGKDYWDVWMKELGNPSAITPESGLASANGFIGYLLGFSIRQGNLALLDSFLPETLRVLDGIKEYGELMQRSLGFGRMARQALHPLIQTLITDPLQWYVNRQYTPKLLGEGLAVRAFNRGWIDRATLDTEMSYAGYSQTRISTLIKDALTELGPTEAWTLYKTGGYTGNQLAQALQTSGMDPGAIGDYVQAKLAAEVEPYTTALIADWKNQLLGGYISLSQFEGYVNSLKLPIEAKIALNQAVGQLFEYPRRKLTLAEVQSAFVEGLLDATEVSNWLIKEGYSDDDAQVLWFQTLLKLNTDEAKKAVAQYKYDRAKAKAAAKGEPPPPPPAALAV
jgi:hypothetical protein